MSPAERRTNCSCGGSEERSPLPWTGVPCSPQRTWAEKAGAQPLQTLCYAAKRLRPRANVTAYGMRALEKIRFLPMYAGANMGHPSRTNDRDWDPPSWSVLTQTLLGAGSAGQYVSLDRTHLIRFERISERGHPHLLVGASQHNGLELMVGCGGGIPQVKHTGARDDSYSMTVKTLPAVEDAAFVDHRRCGVYVYRG
jgi:hypothetical protein